MFEVNESSSTPPHADSSGMCIELLDCEVLPSDFVAYLAAIERDGVADFYWFESHPAATRRVRPLSELERKAYPVPTNAVMVVTREGDVLSSSIYHS